MATVPFGDTAILSDGRRVTTPWQAPGLYLGDQHIDGPVVLLLPDAALDALGRVWVVAKDARDPPAGLGAWVWCSAVGAWWHVPGPVFGSRMILRLDPQSGGCRIAFTTSAYAWACWVVAPDGTQQQVSTGTIPTGEGAQGMRDWAMAGAPRPLAPLDETLHGHRVRTVVSTPAGDLTVACFLEQPDQVVVSRGGPLGTLALGGIDWPTPRLSLDGRYWCGVRYAGRQVLGGLVPAVVPPLQVPPAHPIVPIARPCWVGFFNTRRHAPTPGNCELWVDPAGTRVVRDRQDRAVALYVAGTPESDLASLNRAIAAARGHGLPVLAYWPHGLWPGPLPTGADWLGIDGTQATAQSDAALDQGLRGQCARHPAPVLIGQCYTNVAPGLTQELTHLPSLYSQIVHDVPHMPAVVAFSGYDRATGYNDHPEVHAGWTSWFATAQTPPTPPTPVPADPPHPQPPEPPMPQIRTLGLLTWLKKFVTAEGGGGAALHAVDRPGTPPPPQQVNLWETMTLVPQPSGRVLLVTSGGYYWKARDANTTTFMSPTALVVCDSQQANTNADSWELFEYVDNGDGTVSFKSMFGFYVSCEADGTITCNRTAIGPYEQFVLLPPGSLVPSAPQPVEPGAAIPAVHPDGHIFRLADGTPWRYKGVTAFRLCQLWLESGADAVRAFLNAYPGYNTVRVFSYVEGPNWTDPTWEAPSPDQAVEFAQLLNSLGWRMEFVLLTSSNPGRRDHAIAIINALAAAHLTNVFLEAANEPEVQNPDRTFIDASALRPALDASGYPYTNGCYTDGAARHWGTYHTQHGERDPEWPRRCHDAYDLWVKPADAPAGAQAVHKPCLLDEPAKPQDVGGDKVKDWKAFFGGAALFAAGATFHSKTGKFAQLPTDEERSLAAAALMGLNAFPADAANAQGSYRRIDGDGLRTYVIGDGMVRIRPNAPAAPEPGWTSLDTDHILWRR
jgi:hypothetical protein